MLVWLRKLAAACRVELSEGTQAVYVDRLLQYPRERIDATFQRVLDDWDRPSQMPPLRFILDRLENHTLQAEQQWALVQQIMRHHWHPDIGFYDNAPELSPASEYSVRQCGGLKRLWEAVFSEESDFAFVRRDFISAFERYEREGGQQTHFTQQLAETRLRQIAQAQKEENP